MNGVRGLQFDADESAVHAYAIGFNGRDGTAKRRGRGCLEEQYKRGDDSGLRGDETRHGSLILLSGYAIVARHKVVMA